MARKRKGRAIDGILLLDKPLGLSSNDALQRVKRVFNAAKAGHTGALDPLATGMLPICLGEATKFSQFLLEADKTYSVTAKLGVRTTTSDADGEIVEQRPVESTPEQIEQVCLSFLGNSKQVPSMYSALKYQGKPLYSYARQGIEVPREARDITIFSLLIERIVGDEVDMQVHCSKGTYIRSLVDDIGQILGCGAYVSRLHRSRVTDYPVDRVISLETLFAMRKEIDDAQLDIMDDSSFTELDGLLLPMDSAVKTLPSVELEQVCAGYFYNGNPVQCSDALGLATNTQVRVYCGGRFMGVGFIDDDSRVAPKRTVVRSDKTAG
ncbi:tRNA pseudouridine(55) synthase TruB [Aliiglaciecola sp. LCG003]|uniref:tRNA pseudouridine(55) synthase TruB n=1 Tax=Aliiglaciecola sp. LCG003 TaxID=3053655 RepID=UPI002572CF80|nr:tRNA pseudouridine(55) synthase TruB [Aliiglaciecola sp. LCG003]WJG11040.1 tRNA pseudouridine(55) synthase TruB [Aliiglaciecola sp. LCG003]